MLSTAERILLTMLVARPPNLASLTKFPKKINKLNNLRMQRPARAHRLSGPVEQTRVAFNCWAPTNNRLLGNRPLDGQLQVASTVLANCLPATLKSKLIYRSLLDNRTIKQNVFGGCLEHDPIRLANDYPKEFCCSLGRLSI